MAEEKIDTTLKNKVTNLAEIQRKKATTLLELEDDPNGLSMAGEYCKKIFVAGTENQATYDIKLGSWVAGQFLPLQLLTQQKLMVDLTLNELKKENPYNMPLNSLIKLARQGFIYLNIRDFDILKDKENNKVFADGLVAENLNYIMDEIPNYYLYVGSAMRKPLFDKMTYWQGHRNSSYEDKQIEFEEKVKNVAAAYKSYPYKKDEDKFRGEEPSLIAASWHYAYLCAAKAQIDPIIFDGEDGDNGIDAQINNCQEIGDAWSKNKDNADIIRSAAIRFVKLAKCLRAFHLDNTALLTGSWGHIYNRTADEYRDVINTQAEMLNPGVISSNEYQNFLYKVLQMDNIIENNITYDSLINPVANKKITISENFVNQLIKSLIENRNRYDEIDEITKELYALNSENFNNRSYNALLKNYNSARKSFLSGFDKFFSEHFKVNLNLGTSILNTLPISLRTGVEISNFSLPDCVKKLLIPKKENLLMYRLHSIITKNGLKK